MNQFSNKTFDEIGIYVYCLVNPINNIIFYIWKWTWNRVFQHAKWIVENNLQSEKIAIIKDILNSWNEVNYYIIRHGLKSNEIAFEVEATIIDVLQFLGYSLSNIVDWHKSWDRWIKTINEIESYYCARKIELLEIIDPVLIININKSYKRWVSSMEATSWNWYLNPIRANNAKYIIAEYRWVFRNVYELVWQWMFHSEWKVKRYKGILVEAKDPEILERYQNRFLERSRWNQNPIRYINC